MSSVYQSKKLFWK